MRRVIRRQGRKISEAPKANTNARISPHIYENDMMSDAQLPVIMRISFVTTHERGHAA